MGNKNNHKIPISSGAYWTAATALRASKTLGQLGRALYKTAAPIFNAPGPVGPSWGSENGRPAGIHRVHGIEHIVAARINYGFPSFRDRQQLGREMRISPGLAVARDCSQQGR
jgi:hypothetical protein